MFSDDTFLSDPGELQAGGLSPEGGAIRLLLRAMHSSTRGLRDGRITGPIP